ncbi:uncharacterized protein SEPMUDRAFT_146795 [Sphaerulina musiva SO2202]|uniref:Uncharacterized protein n=1 Tax=Sphaerulina musiva (strain SO2202) TaxID=692275 RepID=N1QNZ5_SPHMS|nr:uncharacterized protein SEPMUDRAFT_146795 [Sphaerulina musiva SO2202]EMF17879.1 hypothetical protein SEPMUDRAFT_146795 [Sphaerulina musiva SO2202]
MKRERGREQEEPCTSKGSRTQEAHPYRNNQPFFSFQVNLLDDDNDQLDHMQSFRILYARDPIHPSSSHFSK